MFYKLLYIVLILQLITRNYFYDYTNQNYLFNNCKFLEKIALCAIREIKMGAFDKTGFRYFYIGFTSFFRGVAQFFDLQ